MSSSVAFGPEILLISLSTGPQATGPTTTGPARSATFDNSLIKVLRKHGFVLELKIAATTEGFFRIPQNRNNLKAIILTNFELTAKRDGSPGHSELLSQVID